MLYFTKFNYKILAVFLAILIFFVLFGYFFNDYSGTFGSGLAHCSFDPVSVDDSSCTSYRFAYIMESQKCSINKNFSLYESSLNTALKLQSKSPFLVKDVVLVKEVIVIKNKSMLDYICDTWRYIEISPCMFTAILVGFSLGIWF